MAEHVLTAGELVTRRFEEARPEDAHAAG
jgi:hypothetical protein